MNLFKLGLIADNPPTKPDCFIILSYTVKNASSPTKLTKACIKLAYKWWLKYPQAKLIMSTGDNQGLGISNAKIMALYAKKLGIPSKSIIEEDKSVTTYQNLRYSKEIVDHYQFKQPTIICLDLHARRAIDLAQRSGMKKFYWLSAYSKGDLAYGHKHLQTHSRPAILCYELFFWLYNKLLNKPY